MRLLTGALLCLSFLPATAWAQVDIESAWARATPPGAKIGAGYLIVRNRGDAPDRLVSASSPAAARVETHVTQRDGEIMRMREVKGYDIPAGGRFELKPGGAHLMFVDIRQPFREGERVPLILRFEKAGEKAVELQVSRTAPAGHGHGGHDHRH